MHERVRIAAVATRYRYNEGIILDFKHAQDAGFALSDFIMVELDEELEDAAHYRDLADS
jgi:hypothetical protein